jgi:hypothetical protein
MIESFDDLYAEVMANPDARLAALENQVRHTVGCRFDALRSERGWSIREMARRMRTKSIAQVTRICHQEFGGNLTMRTLVRAADVFGYDVEIQLVKRKEP